MSNAFPIRPRPGGHNWRLTVGMGIVGLVAIGFLTLPKKEAFQQVAATQSRSIARAMPVCGYGRRINCVVDGDTIWFDGEKIRLNSMNAPEAQGQCDRERNLAWRATRRLSQLLSARAFSVVRSGKDRYGRTLARVSIDGRDVGMILVKEGLAHEWQSWNRGWC